MSLSPQEGFNLLKQKVQLKVKESLSIRKELKDWSIQDIHDFQSDLEANCKSSVSEKWIYLHFKNENLKLPRVDVLNLLSRYCGYKNWEVLLFENSKKTVSKKQPLKYLILAILILLVVILSFWFKVRFTKTSQIIVFRDAYTQRQIDVTELNIQIKSKDAQTRWKKSDLGIRINKQDGDSIIAAGPYYKELKQVLNFLDDTIFIKLLPDDYALMLNFFSRSDVKNIQKRESQLSMAIHEEAKIFQVFEDFEGLELLNKTEFIERLIIPVNYLKNLEILDIQYRDKQIFRLRFRQKKESYE